MYYCLKLTELSDYPPLRLSMPTRSLLFSFQYFRDNKLRYDKSKVESQYHYSMIIVLFHWKLVLAVRSLLVQAAQKPL